MEQSATTSPSLAESLKGIVVELRAAIYRQGHLHRAALPLVTLLIHYLQRAVLRFAKAEQRGPLPPRKRPAPKPADHPPPKPRKPSPFPSKFGWLLALMPPTPISATVAASARAALRDFLETPALADLLQTNPSLGRILRPICHIFGIHQPVILRRPKPLPTTPPAKPRPPQIGHRIPHETTPTTGFWSPSRRYPKKTA